MLSDWNETCARCMDGEIEPRHCEYYGEPNGCNSPTYGEHPPVGNAAAMRDALEVILRDCKGGMSYDHLGMKDKFFEAVQYQARAALSAPPRNCDRFADETDAQLAFLNEVWLISVDRESMLERDRYENWTDEMRARYGQWLLAPAQAQEGGAA